MPTGDQFYANVKLLLHGDGSNGSTTFTDNSPVARSTASVNGNAQVSTAQSKYGGASMKFDGAGDYITWADSADWAFGSGDLTIEGWVYRVGSGATQIIAAQWSAATATDNSFLLYFDSANKLNFSYGSGATNAGFTSAAAVGANTWTHVAICVASGVATMYVAGVKEAGTLTLAGAMNNSTQPLALGAFQTGSPGTYGSFLNGYVDDFRLTKGTARYSANFTPDTSAFPDQGLVATGVFVTNFGTPQAIWTQFGVATGLLATSFGAPRVLTLRGVASGFLATTFGTPKLRSAAVGFLATHFGTPVVHASVTVTATALQAVHFGSPRLVTYARAHGFRVVHFGAAGTPSTRHCQATGFLAAIMGQPIVLGFTPGTPARNVRPIQFRVTIFGTPTAAIVATGTATGFHTGNFGTAAATQNRRAVATGFSIAPHFGTPNAQARARPQGARHIHFGTPSCYRRQGASSMGLRVHFGAARGYCPNAHRAYGWPAFRFGHPRAIACQAAHASGAMHTHFGTASAVTKHRARSIAPQVRFGSPQAMRNPRC